MARPAIESAAAPAVQGGIERYVQLGGAMLMVAAAVTAAVFPGVVVGAFVFGAWSVLRSPSARQRVLGVAVPLAALVALRSSLEVAWLWRDMLANALPGTVGGVDGALVWRSVTVEVLAGPLVWEAALFAFVIERRTVGGQVRRDHRLDRLRWAAISGGRRPILDIGSMAAVPNRLHSDHQQGTRKGHPAGYVRLGLDGETNGPLDLRLPDELATHVFLPGASGSGKTTTVARLADGVLASGYGVVIVDAKAGGLGQIARRLAERYGVPFHLVDPDADGSLGYNPCTGDAAAVANKLVGAFTYSASAEIYKSIAMEAVPVVVRGLEAAGEPVTLAALYDAFGTRGMAKIAQKLRDDEPLRARLLALSDREGDRTGSGGRAGLQHRLGALLEGKFGELFRAQHVLDWETALVEPSVTYIALSALASGEDVELMGRVIAQDLKQVCARRIRRIDAGEALSPVLAVFDEFAALDEADQLSDLLLQARQALMPVVISTQYIPETTSLRKACLGAGLLVVHRVEAEDAEAIAAQFGTRRATDVTHQVDYISGYSEKGSIRRVDKFNVHPNEFRTFAVGQAAVKSVAQRRYTIVRVYRDDL